VGVAEHPLVVVGGKGKAQAATSRGERQCEGTGSDREVGGAENAQAASKVVYLKTILRV